MDSASSMALKAAAGLEKSSFLQTPASASFPSELRTPLSASASFSRREDGKTPITPPIAYYDYLRTMSPSVPPEQQQQPPSLSRNTSFESDTSTDSSISTSTSITTAGGQKRKEMDAEEPVSAPKEARKDESPPNEVRKDAPHPPPSVTAKPALRPMRSTPRLRIPPTPAYSPHPMSSASSAMRSPYVASPYLTTPHTATPRSARSTDESGHPTVSIRQVVTRTYTFSCTPLETANGNLWKRRKTEHEPTDKTIKQEERAESLSASPPADEKNN
ncbi:hypothetical protein K470DRAFT_278563 [Piedraia hortae CBS 480.64]|uniref:Uncharacterized protein n=1 Tax=Piedraia hortae CBS 480.64 TaxID=1314780 RepID=A0A6A7BUH7_9PEZI|nr:hypothetical protein K470DRAFT_278563 [Piedraia hortae CBS 480.64]